MAHPTSDAVIRFEPDGFSLSGPKLMGRQSAGNGFLRAAVQGRLDGQVFGYTAMPRSAKQFDSMVREFDPAAEPVWIPGEKMDRIGASRGVIYLADPTLAIYARLRQRIGPAFLAAEFGNAVLAAQAVQHDPDLVFRREMPPRRAPNILHHPFTGGRLRGQGF